jgi:aminomuconate-semialdehyde/2-hydroxymuconate-6-semialdehyde dehydrogenase
MTAAKPTLIQNFINGKFVAPKSESYLDSFNPANGTVNALVPDSNSADVEAAVQSAELAFLDWSCTTRAHRAAIMNKVADLLEARLEEFALAESQDQGKPVSLARTVDIPRACYNFRYFAGKILYEGQRCTELDGIAYSYTVQDPVGVAALISPWNLPLYLLTWKIAPCIACKIKVNV